MRLVAASLLGTLVACASPSTPSPTTISNRPVDPAAPAMIATTLYPFGLLVAEVDATGVRELGRTAEVDQFGWIDESTVIGLDSLGHDDVALVITRTTLGRLVETIEISKAVWDGGAGLYLSRERREIWVGRCVEIDDAIGECKLSDYLRVSPLPRIRSATEPRTDVAVATAYTGRTPWPLAPTTSAPPDVKLEKLVKTATSEGGEREIDVVACNLLGTRTLYPDVDTWDVSSGFRVEGVRWVSTHPPIYEIHAALISPVDTEDDERLYIRPCEEPLDHFAWLGDGRWAEYHEQRHDGSSRLGSWTIYDGTRKLGRIPGMDGLRVNRFE